MAEAVTQREYETIYILRSNVGREISEDVATRVSDVIKQSGALRGVENWGRRRLAHNVGREKRGVYVYFKYAGGGSLVSEVERTLRLQESVMKFQTVKLGDVDTSEAVEAEQLKFEHIEHGEEDDDETLAQVLGLEAPRYARGGSESADGEQAASSGDASADKAAASDAQPAPSKEPAPEAGNTAPEAKDAETKGESNE